MSDRASSSELKPCPFCGFTEPEINTSETDRGPRFYNVYCPVCKARTKEFASSESAAKHVWNRRASSLDGDGSEPLIPDPATPAPTR